MIRERFGPYTFIEVDPRDRKLVDVFSHAYATALMRDPQGFLGTPSTQEMDTEYWRNRLMSVASGVLVIDRESRAAGVSTWSYDYERAKLDAVWVDPRHRRTGVGRALQGFSFARMMAEGYDEVVAQIHNANAAQQKLLCDAFGFAVNCAGAVFSQYTAALSAMPLRIKPRDLRR